ncbi:LysR family transcriptional regulator [Pseudomonas sp. NFR16]|uniref:LysR family transcriptional regulator n=1 Tax=Pseudomonas sp. NFR16 TaxID=1566248 RepID=UPI000B832EE7|nr:LysR family transcriptional regulator [Pseudomonas sp. NFR16]
MDRFRELTAFVTVVETGGFSAAARRLGDSQSAISKSVNALEKRLGATLLSRSTRSVTLTDQGRQYYERTRPLLEEIEEADGELASSSGDVRGLVRIAAPSTFGRLHIVPLIPKLLELHPNITLDVRLSDAVRDLIDDGVDLAIRVSPVRDPDSVVKRVATTKLVCVGARHYLRRHGTPAVPTDLAQHNCLIYGDMTEWPFQGPDGSFTVQVQGNLYSNSVETILAGVRAGVGIGMFNRASLVGDLQHPDIVTVLDEFVSSSRDISLIWPRRRFIPARVRTVTDFFAAELALRI